MRKRWLLGVLLLVVLLELFGIAWLYLGVEYTCRCGGCDRYPHLCMVGKCGSCGLGIASISDPLCEWCAEAKGVCNHCGEKKRLVRGVEDFWSYRW